MVPHMKTTIEIADALLTEARQVASHDQTTLRSLVEEGLRQIVRERKQKPRFRLRKASFRGKGLRPEISEGDWDTMAYEGRGD
jgi:Arc/MetJ family transcription regulator